MLAAALIVAAVLAGVAVWLAYQVAASGAALNRARVVVLALRAQIRRMGGEPSA